MDPNQLAEIKKHDTELAAMLQSLEQFLSYADALMETRKSRLQKALGLLHFAVIDYVQGVISLYPGEHGISMSAISVAVFDLVAGGIYLARSPKLLDDFIMFSVFDMRHPKYYLVPNPNASEWTKARRETLETEWENLRPRFQGHMSWHSLDLNELVAATDMQALHGLYDEARMVSGVNPSRFMNRSEAGSYLFTKRREQSGWYVLAPLLLTCLCCLHFYREILRVFEVSNPLVLKAYENLQLAVEQYKR